MAEFKVGDKVIVKGWETGPNPTWEGRKGTVYSADQQDAVCVVFDDGSKFTRGGFEATFLELIPAEPKKGDKVEVLYPGHVGKTGVVKEKTGRYFYVKLDDSTRELLLADKEFKIIEEKETKVVTEAIKVGDKVAVDMDSPGSSFHGVEGIVEEINPGKNHGYVRITKSNIEVSSHSPVGKRTYLYGLTKLVEEFTFKDIQKGDTIRRTETWETGTVKVLEGVVTVVDRTSARTKEGLIVGYYRDDTNPHMTLELLDRPKPKHWLDTQPVGVVGLFGMGRYKKTLKKTAEDMWEVTFLINNLKHNMTSEACRDQWPSLNYENDDKVEWLR